MRFFLSIVVEVQHFLQFFICKSERIIFNSAKFTIKVDLKEKITKGYSGEVYQRICRCVERRSITRTLKVFSVLVILLI